MNAEGGWTVHSEKDPRWNGNGSESVGGLEMPAGAKKHVEEKTKELGEPPDDLEWSYMKY